MVKVKRTEAAKGITFIGEASMKLPPDQDVFEIDEKYLRPFLMRGFAIVVDEEFDPYKIDRTDLFG